MKRARKVPYVGITDFTSGDQVRRMKNVMQEAFADKTHHLLMVGVMMSYKTQHGESTKWAGKWPVPEELPGIFCEDEGVMNTLHYADYDDKSSLQDWIDAIEVCGDNLHAIQFDVPWPNFYDVQKLKEQYPDIDIVLQIGKASLDRLHEPQGSNQVIEMIEKYDGAINYALFDMSGGLGKAMDPQFLLNYLDSVRNYFPYLGLAVAGGLGPGRMHSLVPIIAEYPDISCDAQGKLRRSGSSLDPLDDDLVEQYIRECGEIFP